MTAVYISLGSNIEPVRNTAKALKLLSLVLEVKAISTVYRTRPEKQFDQPFYYNCVVAADTRLLPEDIKYCLLKKIEKELGRVKTEDRYAPRTIDLDLLVYGKLRLKRAGLELPDPGIRKRPYLSAALRELKAGAAPAIGSPGMKPLYGYTKKLRGELKKWNRIKQR